LYQKTRQSLVDIRVEVASHLAICREVDQDLAALGIKLADAHLSMLEIGAGQLPRQTAYYAARHDVIAVDLDVVVRHSLDVTSYARMARQNGLSRVIKTAGRKAVGFDRAYQRETCRQLGLSRLPRWRTRQMDATALAFDDDSFDFIYSYDVFEHLPNPAAVVRESARVLRPGGCMMALIHPFTFDNGCHDLRLYLPGRGALPFWPHLRPESSADVQTFAYLNRLSHAKWGEAFAVVAPNTYWVHWPTRDPAVITAHAAARSRGELADFTDEELLTDRLLAIWQKPM